MTQVDRHWGASPEVRIIRELWLTNKGGLEPGKQDTAKQYGRVFEELLIRELQRLADQYTEIDLRFSRGYVVEDYGEHQSDGVSEEGSGTIKPDGPRFDIVCYGGNVAWTRNQRESRDQTPFAVVPKSFVYGVIEAKRTVSPGYFPVDSSRAMNAQLNDQQEYLDRLGLDVPLILVGAHFAGSIKENQEKSKADEVVLLGDLADKETTERMARFGTLANVIEILVDDVNIPRQYLTPEPDEQVQGLQEIARNLESDEN